MSRLIPFRLMPGSWGLNGPQYAEAEARYTLSGEALERRLCEIHHPAGSRAYLVRMLELDMQYGKVDAYQAALAKAEIDGQKDDPRRRLEIDLHHGKVEPYEHDRKLAELDFPEGKDRELALLEIDRAHEKIAQKAYDKAVATLREEPYIAIINDGFDLAQGINGVFFEFDWNVYWIDYLRLHGYGGNSEEEIVEQWFQDVCRATAMENAEPDQDDAFVMNRVNNRIDRGNGKADYL